LREGEKENDSEKAMTVVKKEKKKKRWSKFEPRRLLFHHHQLRLSLSKLYHFPIFIFETPCP